MSTAQILCGHHRVNTMRHTATAAMAVDDVALINGRVCVAWRSAEIGDSIEAVYDAAIVLGPKAAVTFAPGDAVYWDNTAELFTNVSTSNTKCGMALDAAASGDAEVKFHLYNGV